MTKQQLFKLLKRQIEVSRFEAHVRHKLIKRLNRLHRQVKGRIGEEDLDEIGKRDLNKLVSDIGDMSIAAHKKLISKINGYSIELSDAEADFIYNEFGNWGLPKNRPQSFSPLVLGLTSEEWLIKQANDYTHNVKMAIRNSDSIEHLPRQYANKTKAFTATWSRSVSQQTHDSIAKRSNKVTGYWHVSVLDSKTSDICLVRSNKRWSKKGEPVGHDLILKRPPLHPHCRSAVVPITDVGKEPVTMTVDDWLDSMSDDEQDNILGAGKAKMYRNGQITLRDLLDQSGRPKTVREIRRDWFNESGGAKMILVSKDIVRDEKEIERLLTGNTGEKDLSEVVTAVDYQKFIGKKLERLPIHYDETRQPIKGADFIVSDGTKIDMMYSISAFSESRLVSINKSISDMGAQEKTIERHFKKTDVILMDFRNITNENKGKLLEYVLTLSKDKQKKIIILEAN